MNGLPRRARQLRWRIASAYVLLISLTLMTLALVLFQLLRATYLRTLEAGVAGQARLVATLAEAQSREPGAAAARTALAQALAAQVQARVTLIAADGSVLADSLVPPQTSNLRERPEVRDALRLGQGESERTSIATGDDRFYVAVPFGPPTAPTGVARVGVPLTTIAEAQAQLGRAVLVTVLLAITVAVAVAILLARRTTQPLRDLQAMTARVAGGDMAAQVPIPLDAEVANLARAFNLMATRLHQAEHARRTLLSNIAHDLRTPLASLQAMLDALADGALDEPAVAADFVRRMDDEVGRLQRLISAFLELSRIEAGELPLHRTPVDPGALLAAVAARMQAQAQQHGVALLCVRAQPLALVDIDASRIEQVLLNLVQNALNHTPSGGTITLRATHDATGVVVAVADTGVGIAPADLPHIFERFYKGDRARSGGGSGLGLAIARHLVARHGGTIWAESVLRQGTTVSFSLPLSDQAHPGR